MPASATGSVNDESTRPSLEEAEGKAKRGLAASAACRTEKAADGSLRFCSLRKQRTDLFDFVRSGFENEAPTRPR